VLVVLVTYCITTNCLVSFGCSKLRIIELLVGLCEFYWLLLQNAVPLSNCIAVRYWKRSIVLSVSVFTATVRAHVLCWYLITHVHFDASPVWCFISSVCSTTRILYFQFTDESKILVKLYALQWITQYSAKYITYISLYATGKHIVSVVVHCVTCTVYMHFETLHVDLTK